MSPPAIVALSDTGRDAALTLGRVVFVVLLAALLVTISRRAIPRALRRVADSSRVDERVEVRTRTLSGLVVSTVAVVVWTLALITVLSQVGVEVGPLLAGAGVVGIAVGFGAQQLVRDVISGFFVLVEDQYSVGDYVTAGGVTGIVETVSLRLTRIRGDDGVLHHIRNGDLLVVSNFSRGYSVATIQVPVPRDLTVVDATRRVTRAMAELVERGDVDGLLLADPQVLGMTDALPRPDGPPQPVLSVTARTTVEGRHTVRRAMLREALAAVGAGEGAAPAPAASRARGRESGSAARRR
ncbi:MAG TPA: mechanosensitive ion channel family protein [Mycobacteriales bacterium]|nr:mechanosensitive ion channel family protein [Mycobacteriales bacterium]